MHERRVVPANSEIAHFFRESGVSPKQFDRVRVRLKKSNVRMTKNREFNSPKMVHERLEIVQTEPGRRDYDMRQAVTMIALVFFNLIDDIDVVSNSVGMCADSMFPQILSSREPGNV